MHKLIFICLAQDIQYVWKIEGAMSPILGDSDLMLKTEKSQME